MGDVIGEVIFANAGTSVACGATCAETSADAVTSLRPSACIVTTVEVDAIVVDGATTDYQRSLLHHLFSRQQRYRF